MGVNSPLTKSKFSNIMQLDGDDSIISESESLSSSELSSTLSTIFDTDEEVDPEPIPAVFLPNSNPSQNTKLEVDTDIKIKAPTRLPLCIMLNARSLYNKKNNFQTLLNQIGPDLAITSETWEREKQNLDDLFAPFSIKQYLMQEVRARLEVAVQFFIMKADSQLTSLMSHHQME